MRSLPSSMNSCGFRRIPSGKSEFRGIPRNFDGKQLAGATAILLSNSMEIPRLLKAAARLERISYLGGELYM
jgi:hypothetical protein